MEGKMQKQPKIEMEIVGGPTPEQMTPWEVMVAVERLKLKALTAQLRADLK
jgi:hypothetical protein